MWRYALFGLLAGMMTLGAAQPPRTPLGMLWAGTTFELRAVATSSTGTPLSLSNPARVSVGTITHWHVLDETPNGQTLDSSEGWFSLMVQNRGNAYDALTIWWGAEQSPDASPWNTALFEQRLETPESLTAIEGATTPVAPCEYRRLLVRLHPPGNRNTDGIIIGWLATSQRNPTIFHIREFVAGVEAARWAHTATATALNQQIIGEPVLIQGRLYWLTWNGSQLHLLRTLNPLSRQTTFSNNVRFEARINTPAPTHHTVVIGNLWYILTQTGRIVFFSLTQAQNGATLTAATLNLPGGIAPNPDLPLVRVGQLLGFVDTQHRVWLFNPGTFAFTQLFAPSGQPITALRAFENNLLAVGRADGRVDVYQGNIPILQGLRLPHAPNRAVQYLTLHNNALTVVAGAHIGIYHLLQRKWLALQTFDSPVVAEPAYEPQGESVFVLTANGWLHAIMPKGMYARVWYPHRLFRESQVERATLDVLTRADREVPYLYLQAQLTDGSTRAMFITAYNPYNRFVFPTVLSRAPIGTRWLFTGNTDQDLALCWVRTGAGNEGTQGAIYGFLLR